MDNMGMATVKSVSGNTAVIELGSGEVKSTNIPRGLSTSSGNKVLVVQVSGKYLIINVY